MFLLCYGDEFVDCVGVEFEFVGIVVCDVDVLCDVDLFRELFIMDVELFLLGVDIVIELIGGIELVWLNIL